MRVLLVEDEAALAQTLELMLRSEAFEVVAAPLGEEGLRLAKADEHDIIVLDLNLPDMPCIRSVPAKSVASATSANSAWCVLDHVSVRSGEPSLGTGTRDGSGSCPSSRPLSASQPQQAL